MGEVEAHYDGLILGLIVGGLESKSELLSTAFILSGFASIPQLLTMKPKNFPADNPKAHLAGFSFMLYSLRIRNASDR